LISLLEMDKKGKKSKKKKANGKQNKATKRTPDLMLSTEEDCELPKKKGKDAPIRNSSSQKENPLEDILCEDPFEDEFEEEEFIEHNEFPPESREFDSENIKFKELNLGREEDSSEDEKKIETKVWRPGDNKLEPGEVLEYDSSAYEMLHRLRIEWPCLSFDILPDNLGQQRTKFPLTSYLISGTQADQSTNNKIFALKISHLHRTKHDDDEDSDFSSEGEENENDDADDEPEVESRTIAHPGCVNRLKVMPQEPHIVATWSDDGHVYLWNLSAMISALDKPPSTSLSSAMEPIQQWTGHNLSEGFALSWSPTKPGRLIFGDCSGRIFLSESLLPIANNSNDGGLSNMNCAVPITWSQSPSPFVGHRGSVEDLQWSPTEESVFASCSIDGTIRIWDVRMRKEAARTFEASNRVDVNVISWNTKVAYLLASGADDGDIRVWDLRSLKNSSSSNECSSVAHFKWHTDQITALEWDPNDESTLAASGADNQVTIWDLSVEEDTEDAKADVVENWPSQLLFTHMGQHDIKEVHWHPQIPGMLISTAEDGLNLFKPNLSE